MISWHRGYLVVVSSDMKGIPGYSMRGESFVCNVTRAQN
jgi:hypothetical protein